jgi:hypothetical protein
LQCGSFLASPKTIAAFQPCGSLVIHLLVFAATQAINEFSARVNISNSMYLRRLLTLIFTCVYHLHPHPLHPQPPFDCPVQPSIIRMFVISG